MPPTKLTIKSSAKGKVGSRNRSRRFVKHSILAKQARTLTGKRLVQHAHELNTVPEGGLTSCFFREYLDQEKMLNPSKLFVSFYRACFAWVQSQALFMHNFDKLIQLFVDSLTSYSEDDISLAVPSLLRLIGVLGRDSGPLLLCSKLNELLPICLQQADASNVELTTLCFETVGRLFEYSVSMLVEQDAKLDILHTHIYPLYLSHSSEMIRNLASEVSGFLLRKQVFKHQQMHLWSLLKFPFDSELGKATGLVFMHCIKNVNGLFLSCMPKIVSSLFRALARRQDEETNRVANFLTWMERARMFASQPHDVLQVLLPEFAPTWFHYDVFLPWLSVATADDFLVLVEKLQKEKDCEASSKRNDFLLQLWRHSHTPALSSVLCSLLFHGDPSPELFSKSLAVLDFPTQFVPHVLGLIPLTFPYASLWIDIVKKNEENPVDHVLFHKQSHRLSSLPDTFTLPHAPPSIELLDFFTHVHPPCQQAERMLKAMTLAQVEGDPVVFGMYAQCSLLHLPHTLDVEALVRRRIQEDVAYCTEHALHCLSSTPEWSPLLVDMVSRLTYSPIASNRRAALHALCRAYPHSRPLEILQEIHLLEPSYESERPRQLLCDQLAMELSHGENHAQHLTMAKSICLAVLGMFHVKFRPAWVVAATLLVRVVERLTTEKCWPAILLFLEQICYCTSSAVQEGEDPNDNKQATTSTQMFVYFFQTGVSNAPLLLRLFQREAKQWMPLFWRFVQVEYYPSLDALVERIDLSSLTKREDDVHSEAIRVVSSVPKKKLSAWLSMFSQFDAKKKMVDVTFLLQFWKYTLFVQANCEVALQCLSRFSYESISDKDKSSLALLVGKEYKTGLVECAQRLPRIEEDENHDVVLEVYTRVLFAKLIGGGQKHSVSAKRKQVLTCFSSLTTGSSLDCFVRLLLRPVFLQTKERPALEGSLHLLGQVLQVLGHRLLCPFAIQFMDAILYILHHFSSVLKTLCLKRLNQLFVLFANKVDFSSSFPILRKYFTTWLESSTEDDATSSLFTVLATCFQSPEIRFRLMDETVFTKQFLQRVGQTKNDSVLETVFSVCATLVAERAFSSQFLSVFLTGMMLRREQEEGDFGQRELEILTTVSKSQESFTAEHVDMVNALVTLLSECLFHRKKQAKWDLSTLLESIESLSQVLPLELRMGSSNEERVRGFIQLLGPWGEHRMVTDAALRLQLVRVISLYMAQESAKTYLRDLNSMLVSVSEERDMDKRIQAYQLIQEEGSDYFEQHAWIVNQCLFDLQCDDFSLRLMAQNLLITLVQTPSIWVHSTMLSCLQVGICSLLQRGEDSTIRANVLAVLRYAVIRTVLFPDLNAIADEFDVESDFFYNASHLQVPRRSRALNRVSTKLQGISEQSLTNVLLPLAMHAVFDAESKKNEQEAGIALCAAIAKECSESKTVGTLLDTIFKRIDKCTESRTQRRLFIKCACVIFDEHQDKLDSRFAKKLQTHLIMQRTLAMDEELNEHVALSLAKRVGMTEMELDSLFLTIIGQLKRRKQTARDVARTCLLKLCKQLGVGRVFAQVFTHCSSVLNEGGYQDHVLAYTMFGALEVLRSEMMETKQVSTLDQVLEPLLKLIATGVFEKSAVETGYHAKIKLREARQDKALDSLECLAACLLFPTSLHVVVFPFMGSSDSKCREAFVRIRLGLLKNPSVTRPVMMQYCHFALKEQTSLREEHDREEEEKGRRQPAIPVKGAAYADRSRYVPGKSLTGATANASLNKLQPPKDKEFVFIEFVLEWLLAGLSHEKEGDESVKTYLLPLLELIVEQIVFSPNSSPRSLVLGLRLVEYALDKHEMLCTSKELLLETCLKFLQLNSQSAHLVSADVSKASVDLVSMLCIKNVVRLSVEQQRVLLRICQLDLDKPNRFSSALRLLQALFTQTNQTKPPVEIYDLALRLNELVFQHSIKAKEQSRCVSLVMHFLLHFPMESKRLEQHVQLIVKNIQEYEYESGRLGGLSLLNAILSRFPSALIDYFCEFLLLSLGLLLQNDDSQVVKEQAAHCLQVLFSKISKSRFNQSVLGFLNKWFANERSLALACQISGLLPPANSALLHAQLLAIVMNEESEEDVLYHALVSLEKSSSSLDVNSLPLKRLMLHENPWVRLVASRMVLLYLTTAKEELTSIEGFDFALVLMDQLDSDSVSDELAKVILSLLLAVKSPWFQAQLWVVNKLCFIASRPEKDDLPLKNRRRRVAFEYFKSLEHHPDLLDTEVVRKMVKALRIVHVSGQGAVDPLNELVQDCLQVIQRTVGLDKFVAAVGMDESERKVKRKEVRTRKDVDRVIPKKRIKH